jgi:hypothetical protein
MSDGRRWDNLCFTFNGFRCSRRFNRGPMRSTYLRIRGSSFIFKIMQPKLKSFTSLQRTRSREYGMLGLKQGCPTFLTKCPSRFLCANWRDGRVKITRCGTPYRLNCCVHLIVYIYRKYIQVIQFMIYRSGRWSQNRTWQDAGWIPLVHRHWTKSQDRNLKWGPANENRHTATFSGNVVA